MADTADLADDAAAAFGRLYARYHGRLRGLATYLYGAADAEDIAQEAMARAYASFASLDRERDPWPWLAAIARNVARDRYARPRPVPLAEVPVAAPDATARVDERAVVTAALGRLSAEDRGVLVLREWHELSFAELGRLLGRSPNALRQQVFRARRRLAAAYTDIGGRAVAVAAWVRWRAPAAGPVAAAVAAGALATGGATPAVPDAVRAVPAPVAAGPEAHRGTPAGPAAGSAAPARPLLPPRAAPPPAPRREPARVPVAAPVRGAAAAPDDGQRRRVHVVTPQGRHEYTAAPAAGDGVLCAVVYVCPRG